MWDCDVFCSTSSTHSERMRFYLSKADEAGRSLRFVKKFLVFGERVFPDRRPSVFFKSKEKKIAATWLALAYEQLNKNQCVFLILVLVSCVGSEVSVVDPHHVDVDPVSTYHPCADRASDFYLMRMQIQVTKLMRIHSTGFDAFIIWHGMEPFEVFQLNFIFGAGEGVPLLLNLKNVGGVGGWGKGVGGGEWCHHTY